MAEIAEGGGGDSGGKKRAKKSSTRVDMTPMVDLAFLLLTFFVLTSTFAEPKIMSLVYPAKTDKPEEKAPKVNNGITFLLTEDKVFYYSGQFRMVPGEGQPATELLEADFTSGPNSIRKLLADRNRSVILKHKELDLEVQRGKMHDTIATKQLIDAKKKPAALKVLIKTDLKATCKNFIDLIDELKIADVGVIAPVDLTRDEETLLNAKIK